MRSSRFALLARNLIQANGVVLHSIWAVARLPTSAGCDTICFGLVMIDGQSGEMARAGGGGGDRLPRTDSSAHNDPAPGQSDARGVYRSGGDVTTPVLVHRTTPGYTEQARTAKYQGTVLLSVEIDPTGTPTNIKVERGLGLGLNEKAIESVKQWTFKPGQKDGTAVSMANC